MALSKPLSFGSAAALRQYLLKSAAGRKLLHSCIDEEMPHYICTERGQEWAEKVTRANRTSKVLVLCHGDGHVDAVTTGAVSVQMVNVPVNGPMSVGGEVHEKAEELVVSASGFSWLEVLKKGKRNPIGEAKPCTMDDAIADAERMLILAAVSAGCEAAKHPKEK